MEAEIEKDCAVIIKSSSITNSQDAKFPNCLTEWKCMQESENFVDSSEGLFLSSPDLTPSEPTEIVMISLPESSESVNQNVLEEDSVFLTPPEHHSLSQLSSSEKRNPNDCCTEGLTITESRDGSCRMTKVWASEAGLDDEPEAKRVRVVSGEEFEGETAPLDETQVIETEGDGGVLDADVVSNNGDSGGEERATLCLVKDCVDKFDANGGTRGLGKCCMEDICAARGEKPDENNDLCGSLESDKIERDISRLKDIADEGYNAMELSSVACGSEKVEILMDPNMPEDSHGDGGLKSSDELDGSRVIVVPGEEYDGETVPLNETEVIEIEGNDGIQGTDVSDNRDSGGEYWANYHMVEGSLDVTGEAGTVCVVQEIDDSVEDSVAKFDGINRNHDLTKKCDCAQEIHATGCNSPNGSGNSIRILDIGKVAAEIISGNVFSEVKCKSDASGCEKAVDADIPKDIYIDEGHSSGRRRRLPPSLWGEENEAVGSLEKRSGFFELLDELKVVLGDIEDNCEEVDIIETAKNCGWTFPRVRWWPADW